MTQPNELADEAAQLRRRLERERATRLQAEQIAEKGLRDLYEKQKHVELLAEISAAANSTKSMNDVLQCALMHVCRINNWDIGHCLLTEGSGNAARLRSNKCWHAPNLEGFHSFWRVSEEMEFPLGSGLPGRVLESAKPHWIFDVREDGNFPRVVFAQQCGLKGAVAFPILSGPDVVGVLEFFAVSVRKPDEAQTEIMSQIGLQLGRVIERHRAEAAMQARTDELIKARNEARLADQAKSAFLSNMSHELRTPLNAIIGFSEILSKDTRGPVEKETYRSYASSIHGAGIHLLKIVNEVLDFSKLSSAALELSEREVDLRDIIAESIRQMQPQADEAKLKLIADIHPALPGLRADEKRLRQILFHLLSNAVKFSEEGGEVRVAAAERAGGIAITVADTGIGMEKNLIPVALEWFSQIDKRLSRQHEGTGLGLPLTKMLVELHGGTLSIESAPKAGTTVTVLFPRERILVRGVAA